MSHCNNCDPGKYAPSSGSSKCTDCNAGTYSSIAALRCIECDEGKYAKDSLSTVCTDCPAGKSVPSKAATMCTACSFNTYQIESGKIICDKCVQGKYSAIGASVCSTCNAGQYMNEVFSYRADASPCLDCPSCPPGSLRAGCLATDKSAGVCLNCLEGKFINKVTAKCDSCPEGTYQDIKTHALTTCKECPVNSISFSGSTSIDQCTCTTGWVKKFKRGEMICGCEQGSYVFNTTKCEKCKTCDTKMTKNRQYRFGCGYDSEGICVDCNTSCPDGQTLAGCGGFSPGECKPTSYLVPTPQCPTDDDPFKAQATGFGRWDFASVFRADENAVDFRCSDVCDGTLNYDSQQCDGPYACNMRTCAASVQEVGVVIPVRACPVVITPEDKQDEDIIDLKRRATCVTCSECGRVGYDEGIEIYTDWGVGCARECSQLMCTDGKIWDWTVQECRQCGNLRDMRLCSRGDVEKYNLEASKVTGNWPLLMFEGCQGSGAALLTDIGVGRCSTCEKRDTCGAKYEYPSRCIDATNVKCEMCSRVRESVYFSLLKGRWLNLISGTGVLEDLHCQISACKPRQGDKWTGVHRDGTLCHKKCLSPSPACTEDQVPVPCRLPHQARCEPGFPVPGDVRPTMQLYRDLAGGQVYAGGEVNLLNEANEMSSRRFASFENVLIVLDRLNEYQCVWNADGITDNVATPAGISHAFWAALETNDANYKTRGTRACRKWEIAEHVAMPLLPLQNTVSCSEEENATSHCLDRIMLVNTEAYAVSYRFHGQWNVLGMDPILVQWDSMEWQSTEHMQQGADVGGAGLLYLTLRMHQRHAKLAVDVPRDRTLHKASWLRAVLASFAVVDVTEYPSAQTHANVRVRPNLTVDGEAINDMDDLFVPERFWSQPLSASPGSLQNDSSLFHIRTEPWFSNWTSCDSNAKPADVDKFDIAPKLGTPAHEHGHGWATQQRNSSLMYDVSTSCGSECATPEGQGICDLPMSACDDLVSAADVFVLRRPYRYNPAESIASCSGPDWACSLTTDKTLLGLRHVHMYIRSAPAADRHKAGAAEKVVYKLSSIQAISLGSVQQMNAGDPYSRCPMLATSANKIECIGAGDQHSLHQIADGSGLRYLAAFQSVVGGRRVLLVMLAQYDPFSGVLYWQNQSVSAQNVITSESTIASETGLFNVRYNDTVSTWISVAAVDNSVMALCLADIKTKTMAVRSYNLDWQTGDGASGTLALQDYESELTLPGEWLINVDQEDPWIRFCNLVAPRQASHFLVACVQITSERSTALTLRVCAGPRTVSETSSMAICNDIALDLPVSDSPSLISAAFLRQVEQRSSTHTSLLWVVGVKGMTFSAVYSESTVDTPQLVLQRVSTSDLERKHFVKADHLFFTFRVAGIFSPEVLTYLPDFERLKLEQKVHVPTAYAVVLVPRGLQESTTGSFYVDEDQQLKSTQTTRFLTLRRASYIVHKQGEAALPVYERIAESAVGNETTELRMSAHKVSPSPSGPSSFLARYSQAPGPPDAESGALNRALGLPLALGRYEQRDGQCVFTDRGLYT